MAAPRLRKTFHYPADESDDDDLPHELDEEEQENLIEKLRKEEADKNTLYLRIFLAIPLVAALAFLPSFFLAGSNSGRLLSILSITSLLASAYTLLMIPNVQPSRPEQRQRSIPFFEPLQSPINLYLSYLNGALSFLIALNSLAQGRSSAGDIFWMLWLLPAGRWTIFNNIARNY
ncbi:hypothetical protein MMC25_002077 [Agyrium rufum]|nr:hypothetical protein [Agyrium rufum]